MTTEQAVQEMLKIKKFAEKQRMAYAQAIAVWQNGEKTFQRILSEAQAKELLKTDYSSLGSITPESTEQEIEMWKQNYYIAIQSAIAEAEKSLSEMEQDLISYTEEMKQLIEKAGYSYE